MRAIVLIDPDPITGPLTERFLKNYNFEVSLFEGAMQAVDRIADERPDLVVVEHDIVGLNGMDIASLIHKMMPQVGIVMLSNEDSEIFRLEAAQNGVSRVVSKSSEYVNLPHVISTVLSIDLDALRREKPLTNL